MATSDLRPSEDHVRKYVSMETITMSELCFAPRVMLHHPDCYQVFLLSRFIFFSFCSFLSPQEVFLKSYGDAVVVKPSRTSLSFLFSFSNTAILKHSLLMIRVYVTEARIACFFVSVMRCNVPVRGRHWINLRWLPKVLISDLSSCCALFPLNRGGKFLKRKAPRFPLSVFIGENFLALAFSTTRFIFAFKHVVIFHIVAGPQKTCRGTWITST